MSIFAKINPIGLDAVISQVQSKLMILATFWGVELDGYPRCYPLYSKDNGKKGIEYYVSSNEYSGNLIHAERNKFFFTADKKPQNLGNGYYTSSFSVYFIVNAKECKPLIPHRADEEIHADVEQVLKTVSGFVSVEGIIDDVEQVFDGYGYFITDDMQPYHAFRVDLLAFEYKSTETLCILN